MVIGLFIMGASASYDVNADYMSEMIQACVTNSRPWGLAAEEKRNEKIDNEGLDAQKVSFEELYLLSKIIYAEAGSNWITDEHQQMVASVVINRVNSPEFPWTIKDVIYAKGQYYGVNSSYFNNLKPSQRAVENALKILQNGSILPKDVVFQANFRQGSGTYKVIYAEKLAPTYFCYSSNRHLY